MPGLYTLTYSVTNDDGLTASSQRQLYVYQAAAITMPLTLYSALTNLSQALELVNGLRNASLPGYADGVAQVISRLGTRAAQVQYGDVDITGAAYLQHGPQNYSVQVNATVYLYVPEAVHRQDIVSAASSQTNKAVVGGTGAQGRQLLVHQPDGHQRGHVSAELAVRSSQVASKSAAHLSEPHSVNKQQLAAEALGILQHSLRLLGPLGCVRGDGGGSCTDQSVAPAAWGGVNTPFTPSGSVGQPISAARRLLQSSPGSGDLAAVLASLAGELGATFTTQPLTTQAVDLLGVSWVGHGKDGILSRTVLLEMGAG